MLSLPGVGSDNTWQWFNEGVATATTTGNTADRHGSAQASDRKDDALRAYSAATEPALLLEVPQRIAGQRTPPF